MEEKMVSVANGRFEVQTLEALPQLEQTKATDEKVLAQLG